MAEDWGGGPPVNEWERFVIGHLLRHGPDDWAVLHNIEIPVRGSRYEIDLIVVTGHSVCLIDVKGTTGRVEVIGHKWYPQRRPPFGSPVAKLNSLAGAFHSHLARLRPTLGGIYVDTLVVLPDPSAVLVDRSPAPDADAASVASMESLIPMLANVSRVGLGRVRDLSVLREDLRAALTGAVTDQNSPRRYGHWEVRDRLGGSQEWTEYRAVNIDVDGDDQQTVLLRVYRADPFEPKAKRDADKVAISNAFRVLSRMAPNECIVGCRDFFPTDDEDEYVLVFDDPHGSALELALTDLRNPLSADTKLRIITDILHGLAWAHRHRVLHRALTPAAVIVKADHSAMLTGFDYARPEDPHTGTVLPRLVDVLDASYVAPECQGRAQRMTKESDVYAAGVIAFQLLTGELPFTTTVDQHAKGSVLPSSVLERAGVSSDLAAWLQRLCARTPADRPCAADAQAELTRLLGRTSAAGASARDKAQTRDFRNLGDGDMLTAQYTIRRKLGSGTFGVVYQVYDSLADTDYAIKIVDHDRDSLIDRHRQEYRILLGLNKPGHPNVVAVRHASFLDNDTVPYLVFDFLDGPDLKAILREGALTPADALTLGRELAAGLAYLHQRGVYHCDMKPNNVIRTDHGAMIVDFNVSVTADDTMSKVGGNNRYLPPDIPDGSPLDAALLIDRDVYGAGLIVYEALTGSWPYERPSRPVLSEEPADPRKYPALANLSDDFADAVMKAIAPQRGDRYHSADDLAKALQSIGPVRKQPPAPNPAPAAAPGPEPTGVNPFVGYLATLYSQSASTNAGTRGHDPHDVYVATKLDKKLTDDILAGTYRLVIVTGNAGDGKTAFLERLAIRARRNGGIAGPERANGADVTLTNGMLLRTNHDGSQDEGDRANDDVLLDFFTPFADGHPPVMDEVRLIAINEGRLVDFCTSHAGRFDALGRAVRSGLDGEPPSDGIAVVNLNRRSVVAADGLEVSIFERILDTLTDDQNWAACAGCELATSCYARHNALTLAHRSAGPKIAGRLHELFTLAHLRGRLHITLRDTRSALAYMLTSGRDCEQIHRLYEGRDDKSEEILDGFYFTSWAGYPGSPDRLLTELRELDVAQVPDPALDRKLDYVGPDAGQALMSVDGRSDADLRELQTLFKGLPRAPKPSAAQARLHARYLSAARRRFFFECVDEQHARAMLPYRSAMTYLDLLAAPDRAQAYLPDLVAAINRGEGLPDPGRLGDDLALQVRDVPGGTIRSYRLFPKSNLVLSATGADEARYLEVQRDGLLLVHRSETGHEARLPIKLDLFEFLHRLRTGYLPGVAEEQGLLLGLTIFKNELAAAPYQQIVLTTGGDDLHSVERVPDGQLVMRELRERVR